MGTHVSQALVGKGTHFSPTDNELLEHLKE
jgi:hypothetical protein